MHHKYIKYNGRKERHRVKKSLTEILYIQCKSFAQLSLHNKLYDLVLVLDIMHTRSPVVAYLKKNQEEF